MSDQKFIIVGTAGDTTVTVTRQSSSTDRVQGLVLEADEGLSVGDVEANRIILWSDSAPVSTALVTGNAGDLRIWHVWRDGDLTQAWEGDAHIVVDDEGDDLGLRCHDSHPGTEADLVVRINFDRAWSQPSESRD